MADNQMVNFGIGLLILGIIGLTLPLIPPLQTNELFVEFVSKHMVVLQACSAIAIGCAIYLFVLASKQKHS